MSRIVNNGKIAVGAVGVRRHPLDDVYHYLMTTSWLTFLGLLALLYLVANVVFATAYYVTPAKVENYDDNWIEAFFFSVQTMATIGYGRLSPVNSMANTIVAIEAVFGLLATAMATGLSFAKFSRPSSRIIFSKHAVIRQHDGVRSLQFRVGNERLNNILNAQMRVLLTKLDVTPEGETVRRFTPLPITRFQFPIFRYTWTGTHPIDMQSPLYGHMTTESLAEEGFEFLVTVTGADADLGQPVWAVHSYAAEDVLCDWRLADTFKTLEDGRRVIDFTQFDEVVRIEEAS